MMSIYALDSNIISYMLKNDVDVISRYRQESDRGNSFVILPIIYYEIQRWLLSKKLNKKIALFNNLCHETEQVEFNKAIWHKAAQICATLYQRGTPIDDSDIFIAAFCLENDYTLVTNNTRHFEHFDGLKFVNWKVNCNL